MLLSCSLQADVGRGAIEWRVLTSIAAAFALGAALGASSAQFAITVMMAGSASFATPIGHQTDFMVWGPGGYGFADFVRSGLPMTLVTATVSLLVIPRVWQL